MQLFILTVKYILPRESIETGVQGGDTHMKRSEKLVENFTIKTGRVVKLPLEI